MINFLYFLLGQFSQQRNRNIKEIENYLPFRYIEEVENLEHDISFLITKDLLGAIAYRKNKGYSFNFQDPYELNDLEKAARWSLKILKYFFLVFLDKFIDKYYLIHTSIFYYNQQTLKFLLEHIENKIDKYLRLFDLTVSFSNLKAVKYLINQGLDKEEAFQNLHAIVYIDQIDFLKYFISLGYKIEENFCQK